MHRLAATTCRKSEQRGPNMMCLVQYGIIGQRKKCKCERKPGLQSTISSNSCTPARSKTVEFHGSMNVHYLTHAAHALKVHAANLHRASNPQQLQY